jgi:hypothetical protein
VRRRCAPRENFSCHLEPELKQLSITGMQSGQQERKGMVVMFDGGDSDGLRFNFGMSPEGEVSRRTKQDGRGCRWDSRCRVGECDLLMKLDVTSQTIKILQKPHVIPGHWNLEYNAALRFFLLTRINGSSLWFSHPQGQRIGF